MLVGEVTYTPREVCEILGISLSTLKKDERAGRITPHWVGGVEGAHGRKRYSEAELARYRDGTRPDEAV